MKYELPHENLETFRFCASNYRNINFPQGWYFLNAHLFICLFIHKYSNISPKIGEIHKKNLKYKFFSLLLSFFQSVILFCVNTLLFFQESFKFGIIYGHMKFSRYWYLLNARCFAQICQLIENWENSRLILKILI